MGTVTKSPVSAIKSGLSPFTIWTALRSGTTESDGAQIEDSELVLVSARADGPAGPALAQRVWRAVEAAAFEAGVSAVR